MESIGGDLKWQVIASLNYFGYRFLFHHTFYKLQVRFFARHSAVVYFFVLVLVWLISPALAYNFSELIEAHAVDTYTEFYESNKEALQKLPVPAVARNYYMAQDLYVFDEFQTDKSRGSRRPRLDNMYDVFVNIAEDEKAHVSTMSQCQDNADRNPELEATKAYIIDALLIGLVVGLSILTSGGLVTIDEDIIQTTADFSTNSVGKVIQNEIMNPSDLSESMIEKVINILSKLAKL